MDFASIVISYLSTGLIMAFIVTLVQHIQGVEKPSPMLAIVSTFFWPIVLKHIVVSYYSLG